MSSQQLETFLPSWCFLMTFCISAVLLSPAVLLLVVLFYCYCCHIQYYKFANKLQVVVPDFAMPAAVYSGFRQLLPWFLLVFSTVLAKIVFAMAKTQP